jgi:hypothetical protein
MRTLLPKRTRPQAGTSATTEAVRGWTLVEMAGVLAVVGLLMGLSAPTLQDLSLREQRDAEIRQVARLAEGFRAEVCRRGKVPEIAEAIPCMAAGVGLPEALVRFHRSGQQRLLVRDPAMRLVRIPEAAAGQVGWTEVENVRFLLLSSVGHPLAAEDVTAGMFQALWDLHPGQLPEGWGWKGRADDLVLARIDLQPEFVEVGWRDAAARGAAIVLGDGPSFQAGIQRAQGWFLKGTTVTLLDPQGVIAVREVIEGPAMYQHEAGGWHRAGLWTPEPARPSAQDFARMANRFLGIPPGPTADGGSVREAWENFSRFSSALGGRLRGGDQSGSIDELMTAHGDLERAIRGLVGIP